MNNFVSLLVKFGSLKSVNSFLIALEKYVYCINLSCILFLALQTRRYLMS